MAAAGAMSSTVSSIPAPRRVVSRGALLQFVFSSTRRCRTILGAFGIAPHLPVDKSTREDGTFSREDFTFDRERDIFTFPAGEILTATRTGRPCEQPL